MGSEYEKQAQKFLDDHGLKFRAVLIGVDCPPFCEDARAKRAMDDVTKYPRRTHIHGKHYRCTFSGEGRSDLAIEFWNSYRDEEYNHVRMWFESTAEDFALLDKHKRELAANGRKPKSPSPYDVIACLQKSDPGSFEDFCSELGYDSDSRQAENVYRAVCDEWKRVNRFFTDAEISEIQEIN